MSLVKPFVAVQRVQVPSDQSSKQVSSERCDSPGDSWVRSVHSMGSRPRGFSSEIPVSLRCRTDSQVRGSQAVRPFFPLLAVLQHHLITG